MGAGVANPELATVAEDVGRLIAERDVVLLCGGMTGVMEAACKGASEAGGLTIGILPGSDRAEANPYCAVAIATGMGEMRNALIARAADAVIAVGGEFGTLSEIAFALKIGKPVVGLGSWELRRGGVDVAGIVSATSPLDAVERALALAG